MLLVIQRPVSSNTSRDSILSFLAKETNLATLNEKDIVMVKIKEDWQITDEALESFRLNFPSYVI